MNISTVSNLAEFSQYKTNSVSGISENRNSAFESVFQAAMDLVKETNSYTNAAEEAEMSFSLGLTDNPAELMVAQYKANMALQYTTAVRNNVMGAYKEIMNLQF